jgi:hypothetical protein
MNPSYRGSIIFGVVLVVIGIIFLTFALVPGLSLTLYWPVIFFVMAAAFAVPYFVWPEAKKGLAALFIPASILFALGLIFTYTVSSDDWVAWAYAWLLIVSGVGLGLALSSTLGGWGRTVMWVGLWMLGISVGLFGLFATLFGAPALKTFGAALVILVGVLMLLRAFRK